MASPVLSVRDLRIETATGLEIVAEVSFDIYRGDVFALVGESGCGKTTTALALLGHARPGTRIVSGSIVLDGKDLMDMSEKSLSRIRGQSISYVPQDAAVGLNPRHRIADQVREALAVHGVAQMTAARRVRQLFNRVQLPSDEDFLRRYPFELSGGQQQRVAIAMALACDPLVVVLDEPTTSLDVGTQRHILDLIRGLSQQTGSAFVHITHDLSVVDEFAQWVAIMYAGRLIESGRTQEVFRYASHPYTSLLLASVPRIFAQRDIRNMPGTAPPPGARPTGCSFQPRCPIALSRCQTEAPSPRSLGNQHFVSCWHTDKVTVETYERTDSGERHATKEVLVSVDSLRASYGREPKRWEVLHGISFSILTGECLALVGESGSGKTTLGRCIAGLHRPDSGVVTLNNLPLGSVATERTPEQCRRIQIIFQNPDRSLNPREKIGHAVCRPLRFFWHISSVDARRRTLQLLERVRLSKDFFDHYPNELSGGEKQRVAIARALAANPSLLVCDEITSSLDVSIQATIIALLDELRRDGLTLLFITHNLSLVSSIADRILVLQSGEVRDYGETATILQHPIHNYTKALLAAVHSVGNQTREGVRSGGSIP